MKNTIKYTQKEELILPEYGRNIQHLVEYAVAIEDKAERTRCAYTIIKIMGTMFPYLRDVEGFKYKLWDHLAIMSNFQLDIDYPFEIVKQDDINFKPTEIAYSNGKPKYMHYGKNIEEFIEITTNTKEEDKKDKMVNAICNYLKKSLIEWNREIATDKKVIADIKILSNNKLETGEDSQFLNVESYSKSKFRRGEHNPSNNKNKNKNKNRIKR